MPPVRAKAVFTEWFQDVGCQPAVVWQVSQVVANDAAACGGFAVA